MVDRFSPAAYDYFVTHPPHSNNTVVEGVIRPGIQEAKAEFGMRFTELEWGELPVPSGNTPYVLAGPVHFAREEWQGTRNPLAEGTLTGDHLRKLGSISGIKLNMVSSYGSEGSMYAPILVAGLFRQGAHAWGVDIPNLDRALGANSIYPDTLYGRVLTNNPLDIADNIRCETFRLAYNDIRDNSPEALEALKKARDEASEAIEELASTVAERRLWHRAPTDGAIFIKTSEGWLASQTSSNKAFITAERFSLIRSYDADSNTIASTGENPPSSDAPEFLVTLDTNDDVQLAVHFHSNGLTRKSADTAVEQHRTPNVIRYGRFSSAPAVIEALDNAGDGWIILKEHGVLWLGKDLGQFHDFIDSSSIDRAHRLGLAS